MTTDIVSVIAKIAKGIRDNQSADEVAALIKKDKNIDKNIIAAAYSWVYDKINKDSNFSENSRKNLNSGFRVLSEKEKNLIGTENYDHLLHFYNAGILNQKDIEKIIEQAEMLPFESVQSDNISILILFSLLNTRKDLLPGSRFMLYSSDTIN